MGYKVISRRKPAEAIIAQLSRRKCPKCGSNVIIPTKKLDNKRNRIYKCLKCFALIGAPTTYAVCNKKGIIARDVFLNDCFICEIPREEKFDITKQKCPYFVEKVRHEEIK